MNLSSCALVGLKWANFQDIDGNSHMQVHPHGSTDSLPFCTMGSGSLAAMSVFEAGFKESMSREDAVALVARAIRSGDPNIFLGQSFASCTSGFRPSHLTATPEYSLGPLICTTVLIASMAGEA